MFCLVTELGTQEHERVLSGVIIDTCVDFAVSVG